MTDELTGHAAYDYPDYSYDYPGYSYDELLSSKSGAFTLTTSLVMQQAHNTRLLSVLAEGEQHDLFVGDDTSLIYVVSPTTDHGKVSKEGFYDSRKTLAWMPEHTATDGFVDALIDAIVRVARNRQARGL